MEATKGKRNVLVQIYNSMGCLLIVKKGIIHRGKSVDVN